LFSRSKPNKSLIQTSWPILCIALVLGILCTSTFLLVRRQSRNQTWRTLEQTAAASDFLAILAILGTSSSADSRLQSTIDLLKKGGEIVNIEATDLDRAPGVGTDEASAGTSYLWSEEANGYQRLRVSMDQAGNTNGRQKIALIRRFPNPSTGNLNAGDWVIAGLLFLACNGTGVWIAAQRLRRERLLRALTVWASEAHTNRLTDDSTQVRMSLETIDPSVARSVMIASDTMQTRLDRIQKSAEQSSRVMSAMPIGVVAFDPLLNLLFVNRAGRELLGLSQELQDGSPLIEVIRHPTVVDLIQQVSTESQIQEVELELPLSKTTLRLRALPLSDPVSKVDGLAPVRHGVLLTVTDETRLRQLENVRRDFTANVSHELKTPLSAIKAYAETLLMGALEDEEARHRFVERISEQANRLDVLIRDLLQLTRLQSQPDKPALLPLDLDDVLKTCVEEHSTIGQAKNITIDVSGVAKGCRVLADLESLRTVVGNLLSNSVRYNRNGGWVKVSTIVEIDTVHLLVQDNGIGIPKEDIDRIFERFYRVEKARSQDAGGTGLGLSIVKHLVQAISAEIQVRSELGTGSTFDLSLKRPPATLGGEGVSKTR
jgi:two-component system phosphate regulon sensor histidine kinase PhoR